MNKEDLKNYKNLLQELKKEKITLGINISYTTLSTILFMYFSRNQELKQMAISALISVVGINMTSACIKDTDEVTKKILDLKKKGD